MRGILILSIFFLGALGMAAAGEADGGVAWVDGSTQALLQLTGEVCQYQAHGASYAGETRNRTLSAYGLNGADLGVPVTFPGRIVVLFGDSWAYGRADDGRHIWHPSWGKGDSIGYFDTPADLGACRTLPDLDRQLKEKVSAPAQDFSTAPELKFFADAKAAAGKPRYYQTAIANLKPGQALGPFEVPTGAFELNGRLYVFYNVRHQETRKPDGKRFTFFLNAILARSDEPYTAWKHDAPPRLTRLYDFSEHAVIADPFNPPDDATGPGKFVHAAPVVMARAQMPKTLAAGLPEPLRAAEKVLFVWGASWKYPHSNLYLAAVDAKDVEAAAQGEKDASKWWYCEGVKGGAPAWGHDESAAAPLLNSWREGGAPCLGEHDVMWCEPLGCFLLSYQDRYLEIKFRSAPTPWGPWSAETRVFGRADEDAGKFIRVEKRNTISANPVKTFKPDGKPFNAPENAGATYGAYLFDQVTRCPDGSVEIYFTMSTWNPYQVWLMKTRFKPAHGK